MTWPTVEQTRNLTVLVFVVSAAVGAYIAVFDALFTVVIGQTRPASTSASRPPGAPARRASPRPVLGEPLAVLLHPDDPIQDEIDLGTAVTLADQHVTRRPLLTGLAAPCISCTDSGAPGRFPPR